MRQAAEQRSLERVSGFQQSLETESEGILLVDTSTPDWNILFQNEAWLRATGMTRDEVHGGKLWQLFTPAGQTRVGTPPPPSISCFMATPAAQTNTLEQRALLDVVTLLDRQPKIELF